MADRADVPPEGRPKPPPRVTAAVNGVGERGRRPDDGDMVVGLCGGEDDADVVGGERGARLAAAAAGPPEVVAVDEELPAAAPDTCAADKEDEDASSGGERAPNGVEPLWETATGVAAADEDGMNTGAGSRGSNAGGGGGRSILL